MKYESCVRKKKSELDTSVRTGGGYVAWRKGTL
jgi:hypothetical protein